MKNSELEIAYQKYYQPLFLFAFSLTQNRDDAEDLVENVFVKAMLSFEEGHLKAWLYIVLKNEFYNFYKKQKKLVDEGKIEINQMQSPTDILQELIHDDEVRWLYNHIYGFKQRDRDVILLSLQADLGDHLIAELLNLSVENVRVIRHRTKQKLIQMAKEEGYL